PGRLGVVDPAPDVPDGDHLDLIRVDEPQTPAGSDHDAVEQVEFRHLENVLQGTDLVAGAAEHGRAGHGALVGDGRVIVTTARTPAHALVSGEGGGGKTRLVAELAARAADRGFMVLSGRCAELGDSIPYLPLADALRDATAGPSAAGPLLDALATRLVLGRLL